VPALDSVAVVVDDGVSPFEVAVACEVFGIDRTDAGLPAFAFSVCSVRPGPVAVQTGFTMTAPHGLGRLATADLIVVPAFPIDYRPPPALARALLAAVGRGARVASLCSGAFVLGRVGLLDGRRATTHWSALDRLAGLDATIAVEADQRVVDDTVVTSAGVSAGIDMAFAVVKAFCGHEVAAETARYIEYPFWEG